ncbi:MAG: hypothetical protein ACOX4M_05090 [Acetivibrionales bacterium]
MLPGTRGNEGLLSDIDRDSLENIGLELAGNSKSRCLEERFMVYMAFATPSRHLRLSYPVADRDGRALRPSHVISEVKRILPRVMFRSAAAGANNQGKMPEPAAKGLRHRNRNPNTGARSVRCVTTPGNVTAETATAGHEAPESEAPKS